MPIGISPVSVMSLPKNVPSSVSQNSQSFSVLEHKDNFQYSGQSKDKQKTSFIVKAMKALIALVTVCAGIYLTSKLPVMNNAEGWKKMIAGPVNALQKGSNALIGKAKAFIGRFVGNKVDSIPTEIIFKTGPDDAVSVASSISEGL